MPDRYRKFTELQNQHQLNVDYRIRSIQRPAQLIILGIHAGGIEMGTSELAQAIAGEDFSLYLFEGLAGNNQVLHITSTRFDEPGCLALVKQHHSALSLHGFVGNESDPLIYLGGNDQALRQRLLESLNENGYAARVNTAGYAATDAMNVCNRTASGQGVQIELAARLRKQFFEDYLRRKGREKTIPQFTHFVQVIRKALLTG